jgi:hypothetical protein
MEERFWTAGEDLYGKAFDPASGIALPPPTGIIAGAGIARRLAGPPRWSPAAMTESGPLFKRLVRARVGGARTAGRRRLPYDAYCTSTYRKAADDRWRLTCIKAPIDLHGGRVTSAGPALS